MPRRSPATDDLTHLTRQTCLHHLLEAKAVADEMRADTWEFALQLPTLHDFGVTDTVMRWLVLKGYVEHRLETTRHGETRRRFLPTVSLQFCPTSCFVITPVGFDIARNGHAETTLVIPYFDLTCRTLFVGRKIVKQFKVPATNQELVLQAFEEENWPVHLDDPIPPHMNHDSKQRLHATIDRLNRNQQHRLIRFRGDGTGRGICWELIDDGAQTNRK